MSAGDETCLHVLASDFKVRENRRSRRVGSRASFEKLFDIGDVWDARCVNADAIRQHRSTLGRLSKLDRAAQFDLVIAGAAVELKPQDQQLSGRIYNDLAVRSVVLIAFG